MCMIDEADVRSKVHCSTNPKARKNYRCWECGRTIEKGERYRRIVMLCDGDWSSTPVCAHCAVAVDWLSVQCGGTLLGEVIGDIEAHVEEYQGKSMPLARLLIGMRRKWIRFNGSGLMSQRPVPARIT